MSIKINLFTFRRFFVLCTAFLFVGLLAWMLYNPQPRGGSAADQMIRTMDLSGLQGAWRPKVLEAGGGFVPLSACTGNDGDYHPFLFPEFRGTSWFGKTANESAPEQFCRIELNAQRSPKEIDLTRESGALKGIYELSGDTLRLCISPVVGRSRPSTFASGGLYARIVVIYERIKDINVREGRLSDSGATEEVDKTRYGLPVIDPITAARLDDNQRMELIRIYQDQVRDLANSEVNVNGFDFTLFVQHNLSGVPEIDRWAGRPFGKSLHYALEKYTQAMNKRESAGHKDSKVALEEAVKSLEVLRRAAETKNERGPDRDGNGRPK